VNKLSLIDKREDICDENMCCSQNRTNKGSSEVSQLPAGQNSIVINESKAWGEDDLGRREAEAVSGYI